MDERITTATFQDLSNFVRSGTGLGHNILRDFEWDLEPVAGRPDLKERLHYVAPRDAGKWPWSPTSANCFRRDALDLIMNNKKLREVRINTDAYMLRGVAALCGSVLIDLPLVVYRIYGGNNFVFRAGLHRFNGFKTALWKKNSQICMTSIIDHIVDRLPELSTEIENPHFIVEALIALSDTFPKIEASRFGLNYLTEVLLRRRRWFIATIGKERFYDLLFFGSDPRKRRRLMKMADFGLPMLSSAIDRGFVFPPAGGQNRAESKKIASAAISAE